MQRADSCLIKLPGVMRDTLFLQAPLLTLRRPGPPKSLYVPAALLGFVTFIVMYHLCLNIWDF